MTIRKRLIASNIAMIIIPVVALLLMEMVIGMFLIYVLKMEIGEDFQKTFITIRFIGLAVILMVTNGLLTYYVAKSVVRPVEKLSKAAKRISEGDLDTSIELMGDDELGQLGKTFEAMRLKLKDAASLQSKYEQNRKELIANISHDLKTPITSIKGYVEGIRDGVASTPEKMNRYIETIYVKASDMDYLIDELFLLSKLELSNMPFHFEEINLRTYFVYLLEEFQFDLEKAGVSIAFVADKEANYKASADREQLKRIVTNIVQNSLKHMDKKEKEILIRLTAVADEVIVQVQDNGVGIDEAALPHIFDQFYRADPSRKSEDGSSGLGLAIVKRIVEQHGGTTWAESIVGKGTTISFSLLRNIEGKV